MPRSDEAIIWDYGDMGRKLLVGGTSMKMAVWKVIQRASIEGQNYMRSNAPWTDRTGNARAGLFGRAFKHPDGYVAVFYHTVEYGIWLEVAKGGAYRIIEPTIQQIGPQVMQDLKVIMTALDAAGGASISG